MFQACADLLDDFCFKPPSLNGVCMVGGGIQCN